MKHYILKDKVAIPVNLMNWVKWFETADRIVAKDEFEGVVVSTVFLGIDHNWGEGDPLLYETMVFTDIEGGGYMNRYFIWDEAVAGHNKIVDLMRRKLAESKKDGVQVLDAVINSMTKGK